MSGNYDDAIRRSMMEAAQKKQQPRDVIQPGQYMMTNDFAPPPPGTGASVPPDSVRDFKFFVQQRPDTGNFPPTPPQYSEQELADVPRRKQMDDLLNQIGVLAASPPEKYDMVRGRQLLDQYKALGSASPSYQRRDRNAEVITNKGIDADVMQKAIENRRLKGRSE